MAQSPAVSQSFMQSHPVSLQPMPAVREWRRHSHFASNPMARRATSRSRSSTLSRTDLSHGHSISDPAGEQVYLVLFGTGIRHRSSLSAVKAFIRGVSLEVTFAGAQGDFVGLDQVNFLVPRSLAGRGEVEILLTVETQFANPVQVNISRYIVTPIKQMIVSETTCFASSSANSRQRRLPLVVTRAELMYCPGPAVTPEEMAVFIMPLSSVLTLHHPPHNASRMGQPRTQMANRGITVEEITI